MGLDQIYNPAGGSHILSWITYIPLLGVVPLLALKKDQHIKVWANVVVIVDFLLSIPLYFYFQTSSADYQFQETAEWFRLNDGKLAVGYHFGLDGISLLLFLLTTFLGVIAVLSSWNAIHERVKEYYTFMLLLQVGMLGVFVALDFVLFYVFWEVMLVPMYFLIGIWGGDRKLYAAIKFFLYTLAGSVLMLLAILQMFFYHASVHVAEAATQAIPAHDVMTFDIPTLTAVLQANPMPSDGATWYFGMQGLVFLGLFIGFAIKVPMFPFHTWLPDAHVQAPTAGSVILAGVLLKMGTYGFVRFAMPMLPEATVHFLPLLALLAIIGIVYGALVAMKQDDMKKLVAYSSVSHLGFCMLGLFALNHNGILGGMLQMINHGLSTGALFLIVGVVYERRHTRLIAEFGGLSKVMPVFAVVFLIATMSSIGLPALNGFIGEFTVLVGVFAHSRVWAAFAATGIVLGAAYMLWLYQRVMFGKLDNPENQKLKDLSLREMVVFAPIVILCFWIGLHPAPFIDPMEKSIDKIARLYDRPDLAAARKDNRLTVEEAKSAFAADRMRRLEAGEGAGHGGGGHEGGHEGAGHEAEPGRTE